MRIVGLDLGVKTISFCEVSLGKVVARRTVRTLDELDDVLGTAVPPASVVVEACREAWHVNDTLEGRGHKVTLVDTTRVKKLGIGQHGRKTDRIDAEVLALALESGHIPEAHKLSEHRRELRTHMMIRRGLVETRTQMVTTVRGILRANGVRVRGCRADQFVEHYQACELPTTLRDTCAPLIALLTALEPQVAATDKAIGDLSEKEPMIRFLMSAPGVGLMVATMFVSVIDEATRFRSAHHVQSYLGLVPSEDSTGGKRRLGSISKHGNTYLRTLLVQAAWTIIRARPTSATPSEPLRLWADNVAQRRGKRVASIALARRLAGVLWAMWRDGTVYDPDVVCEASSIGKAREAQTTQLQAVALARASRKARTHLRKAETLNAESAV